MKEKTESKRIKKFLEHPLVTKKARLNEVYIDFSGNKPTANFKLLLQKNSEIRKSPFLSTKLFSKSYTLC